MEANQNFITLHVPVFFFLSFGACFSTSVYFRLMAQSFPWVRLVFPYSDEESNELFSARRSTEI